MEKSDNKNDSNQRIKKGFMVDRDLWRRVRSQAALDEKTVNQFVEEALREKLNIRPVDQTTGL